MCIHACLLWLCVRACMRACVDREIMISFSDTKKKLSRYLGIMVIIHYYRVSYGPDPVIIVYEVVYTSCATVTRCISVSLSIYHIYMLYIYMPRSIYQLYFFFFFSSWTIMRTHRIRLLCFRIPGSLKITVFSIRHLKNVKAVLN